MIMFAHERYQAISALLARKQRMAVGELHAALNVSVATLRRDLTVMERAGALVRVHGGVLHPQSVRSEPSFTTKSETSVSAKQAIAAGVAQLIPDGVAVFVDSGTTCLAVARMLFTRPSVHLITNSVPLLQEAYDRGVTVTAIGGQLRPVSGALVGGEALSSVDLFHAAWAVIGTSGITLDGGLMTTEVHEAGVKQYFLQHAKQRVVVADSTKWGVPSVVRFATWNDVNYWVTDRSLAVQHARAIERLGPKVIRCR